VSPDDFRASEAERAEMAELSDRFEAAAERAAGAGAVLDRAIAEGRWTDTDTGYDGWMDPVEEDISAALRSAHGEPQEGER
jgi:hypothetical protein